MTTTQKSRRKRHVPVRTCIGCREVVEKKAAIRLVRTPEGVLIDPGGKMSGRGAYLHQQQSCWKKGVAKLGRALRAEIPAEKQQELLRYADQFTD